MDTTTPTLDFEDFKSVFLEGMNHQSPGQEEVVELPMFDQVAPIEKSDNGKESSTLIKENEQWNTV